MAVHIPRHLGKIIFYHSNMSQLTREQIIANIEALEKQGASQQEIQGWLNSIKTDMSLQKTPQKTPQETPYEQRTNAQREQLSAEQYKPLIAAEYANTPLEKLGEVGKTFANLPSSTLNMAKGAAQAIIHPIATVSGLGGIVVGAIQKAIPGKQAQERYIDAIGQAFRDRYGGAQIQLNAVNDPMGFGSDLFFIISGGAKALGKTAELNKLVSTVAKPATTLSTTINRNVGKFIGGAESIAAGAVTTKNPSAYKKVYEGGKDTTSAFRGNVQIEDVSDDITKGIALMKDKRNADLSGYLSSLEKKGISVDGNNIKSAANQWLKNNGITVKNNKISAPNTALVSDVNELNSIKTAYDTIKNWTDFSANGADKLKQALRNIPSGGPQSNRYITEMANTAKDAVAKVAGKQYLAAEAEYSTLSKSLKDITSSLNASPKVRAETSINTLNNLLKGNKTLKIQAVKELSEYVGKDLLGEVSGISLRELSGPMTKTLTGAGILGAAAQLISPKTLFLLAATSPKLVANFAHALGLSKRGAAMLFSKINEISGSAAFNIAMNAANKIYQLKQQK